MWAFPERQVITRSADEAVGAGGVIVSARSGAAERIHHAAAAAAGLAAETVGLRAVGVGDVMSQRVGGVQGEPARIAMIELRLKRIIRRGSTGVAALNAAPVGERTG